VGFVGDAVGILVEVVGIVGSAAIVFDVAEKE
jgi:hypothetical protein